MFSIEILMTSRQHNVGGDGSKGTGGLGAAHASGAAGYGLPAAAGVDDAVDAAAADAASPVADEMDDEPSQSIFSIGEWSSYSSFLLAVGKWLTLYLHLIFSGLID
jgi:hypothetical protein